MSAIQFDELEDRESILEEGSDTILRLSLESNGLRLSTEEFRAVEDWDELYRYELIRGVLVVLPMPGAAERSANGQLGYRLLQHGDTEPGASHLDATLYSQEVDVGDSIRVADRVIWAGLGRHPDPNVDPPTIAVDLVSPASATRGRDYRDKRREYAALGVKEYWIIDRFRRTLSVCRGLNKPLIVMEAETYSTPLLPAFELKLGELLKVADQWN